MVKPLELKGVRFGKLIAVEKSRNNKGTLVWNCICDCGKNTVVEPYRLSSGHTKSCGCLRRRRSPRRRNLLNKKFGSLIVLREDVIKGGKTRWLCKCDCGNETVVSTSDLVTKNTKSCGCNKHKIKHGALVDGEIPTEYSTWKSMIERCENPKRKEYKYYGGRGIKVCNRWKDYLNFIVDMGEKPHPEYTLERVDNNGDYSPKNCIWTDWATQSINKRKRSDNKSGFTGVNWNKEKSKWEVRIGYEGKTFRLGYYSELSQAVKVRKKAEKEYWKN